MGEHNKNNKDVKLHNWGLIIMLLCFVGVVIYGMKTVIEIKNDITDLQEFADITLRDSTAFIGDSTAFMHLGDIELMVDRSIRETFDIYVSTQSNFLAMVVALITVVVIVIPLILNNNFRTSNEDWYKMKVNDAEEKMKANIETDFLVYKNKVDEAEKEMKINIKQEFQVYNNKVDIAKNIINEELKKGLKDLKKETSDGVKELVEQLNNQKYDFNSYRKKIDQYVLIVEGQSKAIKTLKDNILKIASNHITEIENKESLETIQIVESREEKIDYLESEIEKNEGNYPAKGFFELGKLYFERGEYDKAIEKLKMAIDKNPDYAEAYKSIAEVFLIQAKNETSETIIREKLKNSWKAIEKALSIDGDNICMLDVRILVFIEMGMYENAKKDVDKCLELLNENGEDGAESNKFRKLQSSIDQKIRNNVQQDEIVEIIVKEKLFKMIKIECGVFTMGVSGKDNEADPDENPAHRVLLDDYYISETVVTQELWELVMNDNPSHFDGQSLPVEHVSWNNVQKFLLRLNKDTEVNRPKGTVFCLPTEAQWEYAARGGKKSKNYKYSGSDDVKEVAWYWQNSGDDFLNGKEDDWNPNLVKKNNSRTHPVMTKGNNELGLYDMSGNVWEWCQDMYGIYSSEPQVNPKGVDGTKRVARGGSWFNYSKPCRVSFRMKFDSDDQYSNLGFRLALVSYYDVSRNESKT